MKDIKNNVKLSFNKLVNTMNPILLKLFSFIKNNIVPILGVLVLLLLLGNVRVRNFTIKILGGYVIQEVITTIDTTSVKVDTTFIIDKWINANVELFKPIIIKDTTINVDTTIINMDTIINYNVNINDLYKYENTISDSLIDGIITTLIDFKNQKLLSQNFDYKPKFPKFITKTITVEKNTTTTLKNQYNIGVGAKLNTLGDIGVIGAYQTNKGWQFQGAYNFGSTTKNYVDVGIIKFF